MLEDGLEDEEVKRRRKKRRRKAYVTAVILMSIYYALAIIFYTQRGMKPCPGSASGGDFCRKWDVADAIYFATVTMTTVGYGDLKPQTLGDKYVTIFFILFGFIVRALLPLNIIMPRCLITAAAAAALRRRLLRRRPVLEEIWFPIVLSRAPELVRSSFPCRDCCPPYTARCAPL